MAAHTRGPWEAKRLDAAHFIIQSAEGLGTICRSTIPIGAGKEEICANALLLAAAPDLLIALRELIVCIEVDGLIPESMMFMRQARAALNKAGDTLIRRRN